jgi:cholesterol oxidase
VIERGGHRNLVFLSGDEHRCITATARLGGTPDFKIHSIHSSGLYAPYPFANAIPQDFIDDDEVFVPHNRPPGHSSWKVETRFAPRGQGFALILLDYDSRAGTWGMRVTFDLDGPGARHAPEHFTFPQ